MSEVTAVEPRQPQMSDIMKFFNMRPAEFRGEWQKLSDTDKAELKQWLRELWDMIGEPAKL